jgi:hypothetical protein
MSSGSNGHRIGGQKIEDARADDLPTLEQDEWITEQDGGCVEGCVKGNVEGSVEGCVDGGIVL